MNKRSFLARFAAFLACALTFKPRKANADISSELPKFKRIVRQKYFTEYGLPYAGIGVAFDLDSSNRPAFVDPLRCAVVIPIGAGPDEVADALEALARDVRRRNFKGSHELLSSNESNADRYPEFKRLLKEKRETGPNEWESARV